MTKPQLKDDPSLFARAYDKTVLAFPVPVVLVVLAITGFFAYHIKNFTMDASSDSIVLEDDKDLRYYDVTRELFGSDDYVVVPLTPDPETYPGGLFSDPVLAGLQEMVAEFQAIDSVASVTSILNVPLFSSPPVPMFSLATEYRTLVVPEGETTQKAANRELAEEEFVNSPLYVDYLISRDAKTTAIQVTFKAPGATYDGEVYKEEYKRVIDERSKLKRKKWDLQQEANAERPAIVRAVTSLFSRWEKVLPPEEQARLEELNDRYTTMHAESSAQRREDIDQIRSIISDYEELGEIRLGGVPMIMADIIEYVGNDIVTLGVGVLVFVLIVLLVLFRSIRWVVLPVVSCLLPVVIMFGYLGFTNWQATIVSSNFPSLLIIITMAMAMHIVVRYREIHAGNPDMPNREIVFRTVRLVAIPCLYTSLTTIVGFASLVVSRIPPVVDFGLMMSLGLGIAYLVCFIFFPAAILLFPQRPAPAHKLAELDESPVKFLATFTIRHRATVAAASVVLFAVFALGTTRLKVENRFIDYFKSDTEIYKGMTVIDERLGGTTPLEVVLEGDREDFFLSDGNRERMRMVHDWLEDLPETGKVISPVTAIRILEQVSPPNFVIKEAFLKQVVTSIKDPDIRSAIITPYATPDFSQVRIAMRVNESDKSLKRNELLNAINAKLDAMPELEGHVHEATGEELAKIEARTTGVFVLYNNMLQSLFGSQIKTIVAVYAAIWIMFLVLFRSPTLATIGILPNILPVVLVLGTLGWLNIPLDIMTIMIAAITLGIAVDFAIHYIHRFRREFPEVRDYQATMYRCHASIGRAMYFTSITIVVGFSILMLSNFIPTLYFGAFTGLAMVVAMLASVTLLPMLILILKPMGPEDQGEKGGATSDEPANA